MAILPNTGRKSLKMRFVITVIYTVLIVGSVTMIYPFLLMLSGSVKGSADTDRMDPVPQLLYNKQIRFARFIEDRYVSLTYLSYAYSQELTMNKDAQLPETNRNELATYDQFLKEKAGSFPDHFYTIGSLAPMNNRVLPQNFRLFRDYLRKKCGTVDVYNKRYAATLANWNQFPGVLDQPIVKEFNYEVDPLVDELLRFKRSRPLDDKVIVNVDGWFYFAQKFNPQVRSGKLKRVRVLTATCPKGPDAAVWAEFVKHQVSCLFVRLDPQGRKIFRQYLVNNSSGNIALMNKGAGTNYKSFDAINTSYQDLRNSGLYTLYMNFITNICPVERLRLDTPATRYREYVGSATAIPPFVAREYEVFKRTERPWLVEIMTRNYRNVINYLAVYGRAARNTFIFIGLSIAVALIVNPLAAYALSRFNLKSTYMILMFFLGTMAFPGAVTMIPNFLLLKHLHLLNSFWALILPGAANGFAIFILKGFFDSIPKEIYESALLDGAGEWTMFWRFTMALSKPILALITLSAFTAAYTAFMFALIICPDERMWTLMVWLFQLQQDAHQSMIYAALVLAAIPTLLVFVLAQNTIMKGIVVPVEK
ncbi:MAG: carbohydrate ABC transporter permease [Armatimonadota bacterium]|nr:carbohydrate ABC transporter permease [Armatimonadota bacterium]